MWEQTKAALDRFNASQSKADLRAYKSLAAQYRTEFGIHFIQDREPSAMPPQPGSQDYATYLADIAEWERNEEQRLRDAAHGALNRRYRIVNGPDGRPVREYFDETTGEWVRDEGAAQYDRSYDLLDDSRERLENAPENMREWYDQQEGRWGKWHNFDDLLKAGGRLENAWKEGSLSDAAKKQAVSMLGFKTSDDFDAWMQRQLNADLRTTESGTTSDVTTTGGISEDERRLRNREFATSQQVMFDEQERAVANVYGESGSTMRAMAASDYYQRQIQNAYWRHRTAMADEDRVRREINIQQSKERTLGMAQLGLQAQAQAAATITQERAHQMQAWALQLSAGAAQNQQLMAISAHDQTMLNNYIAQNLAIMNGELGVAQAQEMSMDKAWERHVRPHLMKLDHQLRVLGMSIQRESTGIGAMMQQRALDQQDRHFQAQMKFARENQPSFLEKLIGGIFNLGGTVLSGWAMGGFKMPGAE